MREEGKEDNLKDRGFAGMGFCASRSRECHPLEQSCGRGSDRLSSNVFGPIVVL